MANSGGQFVKVSIMGYAYFNKRATRELVIHLFPSPGHHIQQPHITQDCQVLVQPSSDQELGVVTTIPQTHRRMAGPPHGTGLLHGKFQLAPVLYINKILAVHIGV